MARPREIKVIHWIREDLFAVLLSRYIAERTGTYVKGKKEKGVTEFSINEMNFKCELEKSLAQIKTIRNLFSDYENYREISYEDVVERDKLNEVFNFLKVDGTDINHQSKTRQRSDEKYKYITNIERLREIYIARINKI